MKKLSLLTLLAITIPSFCLCGCDNENLRGPQGEQGIQGEKGDRGDTGPQGEQGIPGEKGETGPQGEQGIQGEKGDKGDTGETGPQGEKGDTGKSAYDIYKEAHSGYTGSQTDWINDLAKGNLYNHITFDSNGGSKIDDYYFYNGDTIDTTKLTSPTLEHGTFSGWYTDSKLENKAANSMLVTNSITLYAKYDMDSVTVTLKSDGKDYKTVETKYGSTVELPSTPTTTTLGYKMSDWTNSSTKKVWSSTNTVNQTDLVLESNTVYDQLELPIISINTENGVGITSKEEYVNASFSIDSFDDAQDIDSASGKIRGRGNSTWVNSNKKSYKIKFDTKTSVLGSKYKAKNWVLLANHFDKTLSRNALAYEMAELFDDIAFSSCHKFVDVYLNGSYNGVYLLCDQVEVNEGRVDIDNSISNDGNNGYLVEMDGTGTASANYEFNLRGNRYEIKDPDSDDELFTQYGATLKSYISSYMEQCRSAIGSGSWSEINNLLDVNSFADTYIIDELFGNPDSGVTSCFFYKDKDGKLFKGPVWDYDVAAGNVDYLIGNKENCPNDQMLLCNSYNPWYQELFKRNEFKELVISKLSSYKEKIYKALELVDVNNEKSYYSMYTKALERNFSKWHIMGRDIGSQPISVREIATVKGQFEYLYNWIDGRYKYICKMYNVPEATVIDGYKVNFNIDSGIGKILIYRGQDYTASSEELLTTYSYDVDNLVYTKSGDGQVNFKIVFKDGYALDSINISEGYKNLKDQTNNIYRITKITNDLEVTITSKASS